MNRLRLLPFAPLPALATVLIVAGGTTSAASFTTAPVAEQGDRSPDPGANYSRILEFGPALNNSGAIAFAARLDDASNDTALVRAGAGPDIFLVRQRDPAPDGNGSFQTFSQFSLNRAGFSGFVATMGNTTGTNTQRGSFGAGTGVVQIIRGGQTPPGGNGTVSEFPAITAEKGIAVGSLGQSAALVRLAGTSGGSNDNLGIYRGNGTTLTEVARRGRTLPGGGTITDLGPPSINDASQVTFRARINGTNDFGFFRHEAGTLAKLVRTGDFVPGGGQVSSANSTEAPVNLEGHLACSVDLTGTANNEVIILATGTQLTTIARKGTAAPGGGSFHSLADSLIAMNDDDEVAFSARIEASPGMVVDSLCFWDGTTLQRIVAKGDAAPDGNGQFNTFGAPSMNAGGDVIFEAALSAASSGTSSGLFVYRNSDASLHQVIRLGAPLAGGTVGSLIFLSLSHLGTPFNGFNDSGQVAFYYRLTNGNCGIALATPTDLPPPVITVSGTELVEDQFIMSWTIDNGGGVDIYRSTNLLDWGAPVSTNNILGIFSEPITPTTPGMFILVPAGQAFP